MGLKTFNNPLGTHTNPYVPNQVIIETYTPSSINIELPSGLYQISCIGAGGGGSGSYGGDSMGSGGGSGGYIIAEAQIYHGMYNCKCGRGGDKNLGSYQQTGNSGGNSSLTSLSDNQDIILASGGGGSTRPKPPGTAGNVYQNNNYITKIITASNGKSGNYGDGWFPGTGGDSVSGDVGKGGNGGGNDAENGTNGYFKLIYLGEI